MCSWLVLTQLTLHCRVRARPGLGSAPVPCSPPPPLQPGWRKREQSQMIIRATGKPFVSGVIWLSAEDMTWTPEDRKGHLTITASNRQQLTTAQLPLITAPSSREAARCPPSNKNAFTLSCLFLPSQEPVSAPRLVVAVKCNTLDGAMRFPEKYK